MKNNNHIGFLAIIVLLVIGFVILCSHHDPNTTVASTQSAPHVDAPPANGWEADIVFYSPNTICWSSYGGRWVTVDCGGGFTLLFINNGTTVRSLYSLNKESVIASLTYYNIHYGLDYIKINNGVTTYDEYMKLNWNGKLPTSKFDISQFAPDPSIHPPIIESKFNKEEYAKAAGIV